MIEHIEFTNQKSFETKARADEVMKYIHLLDNCRGNSEYTICGVSIDGDGLGNVAIPYISTDKKITCPHCIDVINFCKSVSLNGIKKPKKNNTGNIESLVFNKKGLDTSVKYASNDEPILVGDIVTFKFSNYFGVVQGVVCFKDGSFGAKVITKESKTFNTFVLIAVNWEKVK